MNPGAMNSQMKVRLLLVLAAGAGLAWAQTSPVPTAASGPAPAAVQVSGPTTDAVTSAENATPAHTAAADAPVSTEGRRVMLVEDPSLRIWGMSPRQLLYASIAALALFNVICGIFLAWGIRAWGIRRDSESS